MWAKHPAREGQRPLRRWGVGRRVRKQQLVRPRAHPHPDQAHVVNIDGVPKILAVFDVSPGHILVIGIIGEVV